MDAALGCMLLESGSNEVARIFRGFRRVHPRQPGPKVLSRGIYEGEEFLGVAESQRCEKGSAFCPIQLDFAQFHSILRPNIHCGVGDCGVRQAELFRKQLGDGAVSWELGTGASS